MDGETRNDGQEPQAGEQAKPQVGASSNPKAGDKAGDRPQDGNPKPQAGEGKGDGDGEDGLKKELTDTRRENQNLRRRLRELEEKLQADEDAKLSELERAVRDRDTWKIKYEGLVSSLKRERLTARAMEVAGKLGAIEPAAVAKLVSLDDVDFDDELTPRNVDELIAALKKEHPRLFSASPGHGNGGNRDEKPRGGESLFGYSRLASAYERKTK